jgi:hypothetical protein
MRKIPWKTLLAAVILTGGGFSCLCLGLVGPCWTAWMGSGVLLDECPQGDVRPVAYISGSGIGRKDPGYVEVWVEGHYVDEWGSFATTPVRRFRTTLTLIDPDGKETELEPEDGWDDGWYYHQTASVKIPDGPDGDYKLRFVADSPAGEATVEAALPLYQPALAHVLTDAPLYKPGQEMQFRAVLFGAADLSPLDGRPAVWRVYDPAGELLLEEKARTGAFGVVSGSFPLADDAPSGSWRVEVTSGAATDTVNVEVKPFQLPRFTVDASSAAPFWRAGELPRVSGTVRYTSGAPVKNAPVEVRAWPSGEWPPPPEWLAERTVTTDDRGGFSFELGAVPYDLRGKASITFGFTATDPTQDTASGSTTLLFSEDRVAASVVTELAGGLVASANNRMYVRVTTPDGRLIPGATLHLTREWDPADPGIDAPVDADGVARFQLDPGEPTTVVVPAMPVRPQPREAVEVVSLQSATDVLSGDSVDLEGRRALDRWTALVRGCADRVEAGGSETLEVSALLQGGSIRQVATLSGGERTPLSRCVASRLQGASGPGGERLWTLGWTVADPQTPWVTADVTTEVGDVTGVDEAAADRLADARGCVGGIWESASFPRVFRVGVTAGSRAVALTSLADVNLDGQVSAAAASCVERALGGLSLTEPAEADGVGLLRLSANVASDPSQATPQPTTFPGFALRVAASRDGERLGDTLLRLQVGAVPDLRLRFSEVIVDAGTSIELSAVRGPNYSGGFPDELYLYQGDRMLKEFDFDAKTRKGTVPIPEDASGFVHVEYGGARAIVYVRPKATLSLTATTDATTYKPGQTAQLTLTARNGDTPTAAGVTLSGVDSTLATLAPLPMPDDFARVTVRATSDTPAFGILGARALQTGQIAGENAAQAAVLAVSGLPTTPPGADRVSIAQTRGAFTPDAELADTFYELYRHARAEVRAWEEKAPKEEVLTAKIMIDLWEAALATHPAKDPFGRPLHLSVLPQDLLTLADPRFMASDGARLPEDVENWPQFVASEAP